MNAGDSLMIIAVLWVIAVVAAIVIEIHHKRARKLLAELEQRNQDLTLALYWYATRSHYVSKDGVRSPEVFWDMGKRARKVLDEYDGEDALNT